MTDNIIRGSFGSSNTIDLAALQANNRKLKAGMIAPADDKVEDIAIQEHASEPIKDLRDINRISQGLKATGRWRDNMLFIVGINFGLRVSDLLRLTFSNLIDENFCFRERFAILEKKTAKTRKRKMNRYITINTAVIEAVTLYLEHTPGVKLNDFLFRSESNHGCNTGKAMTRQAVDYVLRGIGKEYNLGIRIGTHSLRKTFAYHQMVMSGNDPRKLLLLQKMFGHSTSAQTLDYIGITSEEIDEAYRNLNLGSVEHSYINSQICVLTEAM